jgi:hypothetical protein
VLITGRTWPSIRHAAARIPILIAAAGSLAVAGAGAAGAAAPHGSANATVACGNYCTDLSSLQLGPGTIVNARIPGMTGLAGKGGQLITLKYASNSDPNEDFVPDIVGAVRDFCRSDSRPDGILASDSVACVHFAKYPAYELVFTPDGNDSGYCLGIAGPPAARTSLPARLMRCGATAGTILIPDFTYRGTGSAEGYLPIISGATTTFSHPDVLTVEAGSSRPDNQVIIAQENLQTGGTVTDSQLFTGQDGPA